MYAQTHLFKQFNCRKKPKEFYCTTLWNALEMNVWAVRQGFASLKIISQPHPEGLTPIYIAPTRGRFCISRWSSRLGPPVSPDATVASGSSGSGDTCLDRSWATAAGGNGDSFHQEISWKNGQRTISGLPGDSNAWTNHHDILQKDTVATAPLQHLYHHCLHSKGEPAITRWSGLPRSLNNINLHKKNSSGFATL